MRPYIYMLPKNNEDHLPTRNSFSKHIIDCIQTRTFLACLLIIKEVDLVGPQFRMPQRTFTYTVMRGDTIYSIARKFNTTVNEIAALNNITDPNMLQVGQRLLIPRIPPFPRPDERDTMVYTVRPGDTLGDIAYRFRTTVQTLARINRITNPDMIRVGQRLLIPRT